MLWEWNKLLASSKAAFLKWRLLTTVLLRSLSRLIVLLHQGGAARTASASTGTLTPRVSDGRFGVLIASSVNIHFLIG